MSKTLYEEALADVKQLKDVAEINAKKAIIESVTPRIKDMIEKQLLGEGYDDWKLASPPEDDEIGVDDEDDEDDADADEHDDTRHILSDASTVGSIQGHTKKLGEKKYKVTAESVEALSPVLSHTESLVNEKLDLRVFELAETVNGLVTVSSKTKLSETYVSDVEKTIHEIEDIYTYLQEASDKETVKRLSARLENYHTILNGVKENTMRMKDLVGKRALAEAKDLTLKVTGLPDDMDLELLNIEVIADDLNMDPSVPTDPAAGELPPVTPVDPGTQMEGEDLDDEDVVEISESMLRQEIARMKTKKLSENDAPVGDKLVGGTLANDGIDMTDEELKDTFGGKDTEIEGDPLVDVDIEDADDQVRRYGGTMKRVDPREAFQRFINAKKLFAARPTGRNKYQVVEARKVFVLAKARAAQHKISETKRAPVSNGGARQLAEKTAVVKSLRTQLVETNLLNAKLIHANKLLQTEGLTAKQKSFIIDKLDEAVNLEEVKATFKRIHVKLQARTATTPLKEGTDRRQVLGSSSRVIRPGATSGSSDTISEGNQVSRWSELAGLKK